MSYLLWCLYQYADWSSLVVCYMQDFEVYHKVQYFKLCVAIYCVD